MKVGNIEVYGIIYKITNKKNNKVYIGQTTRKNGFNGRYPYKGKGIERVYNTYLSYKKSGGGFNEHLFRAIEKYGFDSFKVEERFDIAYSGEELNKLEEGYIREYKSYNSNYGYNNAFGGDNFKKTKESILRCKFKSGIPIYCIETKEIFLSIKDVARKCNTSCTTTISNQIKNFGIYKKELDGKMFSFIKVANLHQKPVICLNNYKVYKTISKASKETGIGRTLISKCCNESSGSAGRDKETNEKLVWRFLIDMYENK